VRLLKHLRSRCMIFSIVWFIAASVCGAQCKFPSKTDGRVLTYIVDPTVTPESTVLHITLKFQGNAEGTEEIEFPTEWAGEKLRGIINLHGSSSDTVLIDTAEQGHKTLRYPPGQPVILTYDMVKDWTGRFNHPAQFHGTLLPEYIEINGDNALVHPKMDSQTPLTANFDWQKIPATWVLATSFGTSSGPDDRCQTFSGPWSTLEDSLFTAGDFRVYHFQIGKQPAVLIIRDKWTFSDEEAIAAIQRAVGSVRSFWHDDNFPYFLVTLKAFDNDKDSGDGSAFTNAFWMYMSRQDPLSHYLPTLVHETFHTWNPRRMGGRSDADDNKPVEWFREGFTQYYADLLAYRAGLETLNTYLENVNHDMRTYRTSESAYGRGRVIAVWLDWQIRENSNNKNSLDNVMFDMVREGNQPLTNGRILQTAGRYLPPAMRTELQQAVEQNGFPQLAGATIGPCVRAAIDDLPTFDLGFDLAASRKSNIVTAVDPDGPAFKAGLRDGQQMNGRISIYDGRTDKTAIITVQTESGRQAIEYYPRGKPIATPQFHLDEKAYAPNESSCRM
jgi:predicted metalloprotease with PDZ domain